MLRKASADPARALCHRNLVYQGRVEMGSLCMPSSKCPGGYILAQESLKVKMSFGLMSLLKKDAARKDRY